MRTFHKINLSLLAQLSGVVETAEITRANGKIVGKRTATPGDVWKKSPVNVSKGFGLWVHSKLPGQELAHPGGEPSKECF